MKRCGNGASSSGRRTRTNCAVVALAVGTNGTWTRWSSRFEEKRHYLWRAVDQDGNVLDILVQSRRNKKAAKRFFRKLLKGLQYVPRVIITDKLKSYGAAKREILPSVEHRQHKAIEQPGRELAPTHTTAREEDAPIQISKTGPTLSFCLWSHLTRIFNRDRHRMNAREYRAMLQSRFQVWNEVTGTKQVV